MSNETPQDRSSLFRGEAFEYHFREQESRGVLNTSMRHSGSIALASIVLVSAALIYTLVTRVEVVYRAEGTLQLGPVAIAYLHGQPDLSVKPGARVRIELLRPLSAGSQFIDGRLTAVARAPARVEISLDRRIEGWVGAGGQAPIPIRIHAVSCRQILWRWMLSNTTNCLER